MHKVDVWSVFYTPSWKFKKLIIPNIFIHKMSHEHSFRKKNVIVIPFLQCRGSIGFLHTVSKIQKIDHFQHICPRVVIISIVSEKNVTVINFAENRSFIPGVMQNGGTKQNRFWRKTNNRAIFAGLSISDRKVIVDKEWTLEEKSQYSCICWNECFGEKIHEFVIKIK